LRSDAEAWRRVEGTLMRRRRSQRDAHARLRTIRQVIAGIGTPFLMNSYPKINLEGLDRMLVAADGLEEIGLHGAARTFANLPKFISDVDASYSDDDERFTLPGKNIRIWGSEWRRYGEALFDQARLRAYRGLDALAEPELVGSSLEHRLGKKVPGVIRYSTKDIYRARSLAGFFTRLVKLPVDVDVAVFDRRGETHLFRALGGCGAGVTTEAVAFESIDFPRLLMKKKLAAAVVITLEPS
jgi:hypothetical protein